MNRSLIFMISLIIALTSCAKNQGKIQNGVKSEAEPFGLQEAMQPVFSQADEVSPGMQLPDSALIDSTGGTRKLTKNEFLNAVWNYEKSPKEWVFLGNRPAIIDFYADWCGPCKIASPILEAVSHEFAGKIVVYKIDTEKEQELAAVFGVSSIPAFLYIPKNGKPVMMAGIARTKEATKQMFIDNINKILLSAE
jgi:thioredoxin 1